MRKININITDMQSTHCMNMVKTQVSAISGVKIEKISPGRLEFSVEKDQAENAVLEAVVDAGYTVSSELVESSSTCHSTCCTL